MRESGQMSGTGTEGDEPEKNRCTGGADQQLHGLFQYGDELCTAAEASGIPLYRPGASRREREIDPKDSYIEKTDGQ